MPSFVYNKDIAFLGVRWTRDFPEYKIYLNK